jgi:GTPase
MPKKEFYVTADMRPRTLIVGVFAPQNRMRNPDCYFDEFVSLVETLGDGYDDSFFTKVRYVDTNTFFTKGKLQELIDFCEGKGFEMIILSEILSPLQERNLEDALGGVPIMDREQLILNIFKKSSKTAEGQIQIEMAEIEFNRTRLIGKGQEYAQQAGFIGTRGPGETLKEEIKRIYADKYRQAKRKLDTLYNARTIQRKQRLENKIPLMSIIGYTNAGKSSLLNRLTKSEVLAENKLFATLDITTREFYVDRTKKFLLSDTVGFISNLPHNLIEAFKSTLDELSYANTLLHVIDLSNPSWQEQIEVVNTTLRDLHVGDKPIIHVFNKIDRISAEEMEALQERLRGYSPAVFVNTMSKEGVAPLLELLKTYTF